MNYFECCHRCTPPERYPGCSATCPKYKEGRARYDADKAKANKHISVKYYINERCAASIDGVAKYVRRRPKRSYHK